MEVARQLQGLFSPESATYKVLELGWNSERDILVEKTDFDRSVFDATKFDEDYKYDFYGEPTESEKLKDEGIT